jgi:predicted acyltransferase
MSENQRLLSLDFFRGFTIAAMILVNNPGSWSHVYPPLLHAPWHGWTPTDLIFPFFLFIVGVSITLSFSTNKENHAPRKDLYKKIIRRTIILFALGLFL